MVQADSEMVDGDDNFIKRAHQLIQFKAPDADGAIKGWEGVLVEVIQNTIIPDGSSTAQDAGSIRVLHDDGFVRIWGAKEVSNVRSVHLEPYTATEVDFKVDRSIFRGGTRKANQLRREALLDKQVEVWNEMSRCWREARVVKDDEEIVVAYKSEDKAEEALNHADVWRLKGEDTMDGILREREHTIVNSPHTKCMVTFVQEKKLVHVYKQLSSNDLPSIRTSKALLWIEETLEGGGRVCSVVNLPYHADMNKPVDAVMDNDKWLLISYAIADEDTNGAAD